MTQRDAPPLRAWFTPGLLGLHALGVLAICVCIAGGLWQLGVYDARQAHERADRQEVPTVPLDGLWGPDEPFDATLNHRPVTVEGTFGPADEQVWVEGKEQGGRDGYWLLAPVLPTKDLANPTDSGKRAALLVVRGWAPSAGSVPDVPAGEQTFDAVLEQGEGASSPMDADRVIGSVRVPALLNVLPYDLYSGFAIATDDVVRAGSALATPPSPEVPWTDGLRNLAYSVQWWVFGAFALFMWWRMASELLHGRPDDGDDGGDDAEKDPQERLGSLTP